MAFAVAGGVHVGTGKKFHAVGAVGFRAKGPADAGGAGAERSAGDYRKVLEVVGAAVAVAGVVVGDAVPAEVDADAGVGERGVGFETVAGARGNLDSAGAVIGDGVAGDHAAGAAHQE